MKILCYGDSNTWGYVPNINGYSKNLEAKQYKAELCWWYALQQGNELIVDGLCGRCVAHENKWLQGRNSFDTIVEDLCKYQNLDLVIVQLGTNDCKSEYGDSSQQITKNLQDLLEKIRSITKAHTLVISPPVIKENNKITKKYYVGAQKKSEQLDELYKKMAIENGYIFVSGADLEVGEDGEHLTIHGHKMLSNKVNEAVAKFCLWNESSI